jgi:hypothetical protein
MLAPFVLGLTGVWGVVFRIVVAGCPAAIIPEIQSAGVMVDGHIVGTLVASHLKYSQG